MEILAILFSPLIAVLVTVWLNNREHKRKDRLEIFKTLMTCRENNSNIDFVNAVNSIDVVFHDVTPVRDAWKTLNNAYHSNTPDFKKIQDSHTKLLEVMAHELGYKKQITWETITSSYSPNWLNQSREQEQEFKNMQMELIKSTVEKSKESETKQEQQL